MSRPRDRRRLASRRGWRGAGIILVVALAVGAWLVKLAPAGEPPSALPGTEALFSLDLEVIGSLADAPLVYVVEQRARPGYRIFSFDPATGTEKTVFTVPTGAIVYGIDLAADGSTLAVAYTPDHGLDGSGLWTLDVASGALTMLTPVRAGVYLTDPEWSADGDAVLATRVDRTGADEVLDIAAVSLSDGSVAQLVDGAIHPAVSGSLVYYLEVDPATTARKAVGVLDLATGRQSLVASSDLDLDNLVAGGSPADVAVAALSPGTGGGLTLGTSAAAHGNHDVPSTWWNVTTATESDLSPTTVYDADRTGKAIASVTLEGLSITTDTEVLLIRSRALRFVTS